MMKAAVKTGIALFKSSKSSIVPWLATSEALSWKSFSRFCSSFSSFSSFSASIFFSSSYTDALRHSKNSFATPRAFERSDARLPPSSLTISKTTVFMLMDSYPKLVEKSHPLKGGFEFSLLSALAPQT